MSEADRKTMESLQQSIMITTMEMTLEDLNEVRKVLKLPGETKEEKIPALLEIHRFIGTPGEWSSGCVCQR